MKRRERGVVAETTAGESIIASLEEAIDWVEGKDVAVRVSTLDVPVDEVRGGRLMARGDSGPSGRAGAGAPEESRSEDRLAGRDDPPHDILKI